MDAGLAPKIEDKRVSYLKELRDYKGSCGTCGTAWLRGQARVGAGWRRLGTRDAYPVSLVREPDIYCLREPARWIPTYSRGGRPVS